MSSQEQDPQAGGPDLGGPAGMGEPGPAGREPSEAELRAAYEAELARITSTDMILQSAVSLLNLGSYRLVPRPPAGADAGETPGAAGHGAASPGAGQDLDQVRDSIDAVRALLDILERRVPSELRPLRDALSQLQMAYAREVSATGGGPTADGSASGSGPAGGEDLGGEGGGGSSGEGGSQQPPGGQSKPGPGPAESSGRLWVPGR